MKKEFIIFQFNADTYYNRSDVERFSYDYCMVLANSDKENVTKFSGDQTELQTWLNDKLFDVDNCYYKVILRVSD